MKKFTLGTISRAAKAMAREAGQEILAAAGAVRHAIEHLVGRRAAAAADRVMAAELVLDDDEHWPRDIGIEPVAVVRKMLPAAFTVLGAW